MDRSLLLFLMASRDAQGGLGMSPQIRGIVIGLIIVASVFAAGLIFHYVS